MTDKSLTILIPAAGYGRRQGSPPAKELMIVPSEKQPLMQWGLDLCGERFSLCVISRSDKVVLNDYLAAKGIDHIKISSSQEWPDTILQAEEKWTEKNIVLLPDTRFAPTNILERMNEALDRYDFCFATFSVKDGSTWGVIREDSIAEKPRATEVEDEAWGLFGFRKEKAEVLLQLLLESGRDHLFKRLPGSFCKLRLDYFNDLCR